MIPHNLHFYLVQTAALFAGLALFLGGMSAMSKGLQEAAGKGLRRILQRATAHRLPSLGLGTLLGGLIHSSAASIMLIGFISAGLITFTSSIPAIIGINIGTNLSMLMISFRLGDACWLAILAGVLLRLRPRSQPAGTALLGFGLIFLGLNIMSASIFPFREELAPILRFSDGTTMRGMLTGVIVAMLFTSIIQSSGATIGIVFAMLTAGAMTSFEQAYPVIIGANVGTCATALIGAAGGTTEAKRLAMTHLIFNIFAAILSIATAPIMYRYIPLTTPLAATGAANHQILVSQCANANVIKTIISALLVLPLTRLFATGIRYLMPDRKQEYLKCLLDPELAETPENALQAAILELHRMTELCTERLRTVPQLLLQRNTTIRLNMQETETAVITIQESMHRFLQQLARTKLTRRQATLAALLYNCIDHIERIADHIGVLAQILGERHRMPDATLVIPMLDHLLELNQHTVAVLQALEGILVPLPDNRDAAMQLTLERREIFMTAAVHEQDRIAADLADGTCTPPAAIFRSRFTLELTRIIKHARALALQAQDPDFQIKTKRLVA